MTFSIDIDPHDWTKIEQVLEMHMSTLRDKANQPLPNQEPFKGQEIDSEQLRDQVWTDYRKDREDRICSRCGSYNKYEIIQTTLPTAKDLNDKYNYNFFNVEYSIRTTNIRNKDSLGEVSWGNVCKQCSDHMLGVASYPLASSQLEAERELTQLKKKEHLRRLAQDTEITEARKQINKARRDGKDNEFKQERNSHVEK